MLNLAEYRQRPALLADWLPWAGLIAPGVILNKTPSADSFLPKVFSHSALFRATVVPSSDTCSLSASRAS